MAAEIESGGHWRDQKEKASGFWQMRLMLAAYRILGRGGLRILIVPSVAAFWLFAPKVRSISRDYLRRAAEFHGRPAPRPRDSLGHILSFAYSMVEKIAAWSNGLDLSSIRFRDDDVGALIEALERGDGALIICSHLGNAEILRALAMRHQTRVSRPFGVVSVVDFEGTAQFNRLIRTIDPASTLSLMSASSLDLESALAIQERLAAGDLVVIAGDRTASDNRGKVERVRFLGEEAEFPSGVFTLASLMGAPVYFMFGVRIDDLNPESAYELRVLKACTPTGGCRSARRLEARALLTEFAGHLESLSGEHPLQWYNFYNFWHIHPIRNPRTESAHE